MIQQVETIDDRARDGDGARRRLRDLQTFVAILAASELTYVEASATQQSDDWIRSNERALRYFGGSTQVIVPDNLRSAVSRSDPYEPGINATFDAFAAHYGVVIMPARVRQARDKSLVESAVRLTYQRIYTPLRDRTFHSLDELNAAIMPLLEKHNRRRFQRLPYSRRELFEQIKRHTLAPLPRHHFPLQQTREVTVQFNYHVELRERPAPLQRAPSPAHPRSAHQGVAAVRRPRNGWLFHRNTHLSPKGQVGTSSCRPATSGNAQSVNRAATRPAPRALGSPAPPTRTRQRQRLPRHP